MIFFKRLKYTAIAFFIILSFRLVAEPTRVLTFDDGKAHYIIEVIKHITWPNEGQISHFNIIILGNNRGLLKALNNKTSTLIRGKGISVVQLEKFNKADAKVDVVIVSRNKSALIPEVIENNKNVLIINDGPADKEYLMVGLSIVRKNIKLALNRENLIKQGFKISNVMLDFAGTKADLREQLKDRESTLHKTRNEVEIKEKQLNELNTSLTKNKEKLQTIQSNLIKQSKLLDNAQTQLLSLKSNKAAVILELTSKKNSLLTQQKLLTEKAQEHKQQQNKLKQLNINIKQAENKLSQQVTELEQQSGIITKK